MMFHLDPEEQHELAVRDAQAELTQLKAMRTLLRNNDLAATLTCCGLEIGICDNSWLITAIENQMKEIEKFMAGLPNSWE